MASLYQLNPQASSWPPLALEPFLVFLERRLALQPEDVVTLVLADDALIQPMNATYRGKDAPTNVLSFNSDAPDELGDLIFALETIEREAQEQAKPFEMHLQHLILHGSLHLLGHDHETEAEATAMEALEVAILADYGLPDPYAALGAPL